MSAVMKDLGAITKDQKNVAQGFKFRGIDQFVNTLYPALCRHGVFMAPRCTGQSTDIREVVRSNGKPGVDKHVSIQMEYDFFAEDGSKVTVGPLPAEGVDSGDKATNKALSAALKYALIQTFSIPTEDMAEGDLDSPVLGTAPKKLAEGPSTTVSGDLPISNGGFTPAVAKVPIGPVITVAELETLPSIAALKEDAPVKKSSFRKQPKTPVVTEPEWT